MDTQGKEGSYAPIFIAMAVSIVIAFFWQHYAFIKNAAHSILDPTAGALLNWNLTWGMTLIVFILTLFTTIVQKYATDQKTLREMKEQQKKLQEDLKKLKVGTKEHNELSMKSMEFVGPMMKLSMRPVAYTAIPFILFIRWFIDYFTVFGDFKFFGIFSWFWFYLLGSIIFSSVLRKIMKVV